MTFEQAENLLRATRLTGVFKDLEVSIRRCTPACHELLLTWKVEFRDVGVPGNIYLSRDVPEEHLKEIEPEKFMGAYVHSALLEITKHELEENVELAGSRIWDPHEPGRDWVAQGERLKKLARQVAR